MAIRGDGDLIKQVGTNFQTWSDQMTELFRAIDGSSFNAPGIVGVSRIEQLPLNG